MQVDLEQTVLSQDDDAVPAAGLGRGRLPSRKNNKGGDASSAAGPSGRRAAGKAAPKIENIDLVAGSKANMLMVTVESVHNALQTQIAASREAFQEHAPPEAPPWHCNL